MRIVVVTQYFAPESGAPPVRLAALTRTLRAQGHDVEVVTAMPNHPLGRIFPNYRGRLVMKESVDGIPVRRVCMYAALGSGLRRMLSYASFAAMLPLALAGVRRPDVVFVESPPPFGFPIAWCAARIWRARVVLNVADLWPDAAVDVGALREGFVLRAARRLERWCYRHADAVAVVTEGLVETLVNDRGVPHERVVLLPNGVDLDLFSPGPPDAAIAAELSPDGGPLFLYAGTIGLAHGADVAIRALEQVHESHPDAHLVFMGGGSDRARLDALVADEKVAGVRFVDPRSSHDVARATRLAVAGIATLKRGPTASSTRLAKMFPPMACGRPLLMSGEGEGAELVAEAGAAIVVPPGDADALADAMITVIDQPARASELGAAGRRLVEARFGWDAIVAHWIDQIHAYFQTPVGIGTSDTHDRE